jgi:shikimate dehydrogenase
MTFAGVLGLPVRHSRSPAMMNAAFAELGLDWRYLALPVTPERLEEVVRALPGSGYVGANVTIPHKLAAHELADELTPSAAAIGAANTLSFADGRIVADNTDAGGFLDALVEPPPASALVLGAGGAARAVVWVLREAGVDVAVWNRTPERGAGLARQLGARHVERPEPVELIVNATSVGLTPLPEAEALEALGLGGIEAPAIVCDLVYGDEQTPLERWGERGGSRVIGGLEVLVRQGARSLEGWTGKQAPLETMRRAAATAGAF